MSRTGRPRRDDLAFINRAAELWGAENEEFGFLARVFTQTALPYRDPGSVPEWRRRNGALTLTVQPGPSIYDPKTGQDQPTGYPFGSIPRLLLVWMSTEAVKTRSRVLPLGESLSDFMRQLSLGIDGRTIGRLRDQTRRLFRARIVVDVRESSGTYMREASQQLTIADRYGLLGPSTKFTTLSPKHTAESVW